MAIELVPSIYRGAGKEGDFLWMIDRTEYADALFIFNDNEEQWNAFRLDKTSTYGTISGAGNAAIRPWQAHNPPRAVGIPTGRRDCGGYGFLTDEAKEAIDKAVDNLHSLLYLGHYKRVIYSAANERGELGTGIFRVGQDAKAYIIRKLIDAVRKVNEQ